MKILLAPVPGQLWAGVVSTLALAVRNVLSEPREKLM